MHNKPRRLPQMGFTLGYRLMHLPPSQWVEVYDEDGREVGIHRDVEGLVKNALVQARDMQLQVVGTSETETAWIQEQSREFRELAHKLAQHQEQFAKSKKLTPASLRYQWAEKNGRLRLSLS